MNTSIKAFLFGTLMLTAGVAAAEATSPLGKVMLQMASDLKTIQGNLAASPASIHAAEELATLAGQARDLPPQAVAADASELAAYQQALDELASLASKLEDELKQGDSAGAKGTLADIVDLRGDSHERFKK